MSKFVATLAMGVKSRPSQDRKRTWNAVLYFEEDTTTLEASIPTTIALYKLMEANE